MRVVKKSTGQTMRFGLIVIHPHQPLRPVVSRWKHVRSGRKLRRSSIDGRLRIYTQRDTEWRSGTAQIGECAEVQIESGIIRKERAQVRHRVSRGNLHNIVSGSMPVLLLEACKEERSILSNRTAGGEPVNI